MLFLIDMFDFLQVIRQNPWIFLGILFISVLIISAIIILIIHIIDTNKLADFDKSIIPILPSSSEICDDCQYINQYTTTKSINDYTCIPTQYQIDLSLNCKDNFCYPDHSILYKNCFNNIYKDCNICEYNNIANNTDSCFDNALNKVDGGDNDRNNFIRSLYIAHECKDCLPSLDQLNTNIETTRLQCLLDSNPYCTSCDFLEAMKTSCVDVDNTIDDITDKQYYIGNKCGCTPTVDQLDILNNIKDNNQNHIDCASEPYCDTTIDIKNLCYDSLSNVISETIKPYENNITLPPLSNDAIICNNNCDFVNMFSKKCFYDSLIGSDGSSDEIRKLIYENCNNNINYCVPTESQTTILNNMLNDGILPWNCINNVDNCDYINNSTKSIVNYNSVCI